ncbi:MAG: DegT/DnrJ/EryC1/StrS family aminotransferase [Pseudomonadota bacterium]
MMVPFLDLKAAYEELAPVAEPLMLQSLRSGRYILGAEVETFEHSFAAYCEAEHAVGVANGLDALKLALIAVGVEPGDKVLVPSHTFVATWLAVTQCGAVPIPVEPDEATYNITPEGVRAAFEPDAKALIAVHLYGQPADVAGLADVARELGIAFVEDAAQAHGARWSGARVGGQSDAACWSFYPGKNMGALGDAGAVTTSDPGVAERVRLLRNYGSREKYRHEIPGMNSRLDPVQAVYLSVKMDVLDDWNRRRRAVADHYRHAFSGLDLVLPAVRQEADPSWHLFVVRSTDRDGLAARLADKGVQTLIHYPIAPHLQGAYADMKLTRDDLPLASRLADEVLSLPIGPHLSEAQIEKVIAAVKASA